MQIVVSWNTAISHPRDDPFIAWRLRLFPCAQGLTNGAICGANFKCSMDPDVESLGLYGFLYGGFPTA